MAHAISKNINGQYECFTAGEPAWHRLGANVEKTVTWKEAMQLANLNWMVRKEQLEFNGKKVDAWGNFRADSGKFLGAVGPDYVPIQNRDAFDFVDTILQAENGAHYETAGALFGGKRIWCLARIPHDIRISGTDDISKNYFLFFNRHDGINSAIGKLCNTRVVCNNTATFALREKGKTIKIRHTKSSEEQLKNAIDIVNETTEQIKDLDSLMNVLAKVQLDPGHIKAIIETVYSNIYDSVQEQNKARNVIELFEDNDNNAFPSQRGTAYNLYNAFTKYEDHFSSARVASATETDEDARARKSLFGMGEMMKFQVLTAITNTLHKNNLASFDTKIVKLDSELV